MKKQQQNMAAIYLRLSRDDGGDSESNSIQTQRMMLRRYCKEQGFNVHDSLVTEFSSIGAKTTEQQDSINRETGYFTENAARMQYASFKKQHLFVGSGVIEAGCKNVVGKRLKQSGMRWSLRGANAVIALRCSILSGSFEQSFERLNAA